MDIDGDGFLSKSEVKGRLLERFASIDADGNGLLSKEEVMNAPKPERRQGPRN
jgi:Ca2+-binding EF-hand superfamily protein